MPALVAAGVRIRGVRTAEASLEDRFVALTGEGFDVEGEPGATAVTRRRIGAVAARHRDLGAVPAQAHLGDAARARRRAGADRRRDQDLLRAATPARGPSFLPQIAGNGLFLGVAALVLAIPLFLPLTIGVVAGDTIAGEASQGTLRYLLVAPAGRPRLLLVKFLGAAVFCFAAPLTVVVAGTLDGLALFPIGPVTLLSGDQVPFGEGLLRLLAARRVRRASRCSGSPRSACSSRR